MTLNKSLGTLESLEEFKALLLLLNIVDKSEERVILEYPENSNELWELTYFNNPFIGFQFEGCERVVPVTKEVVEYV